MKVRQEFIEESNTLQVIFSFNINHSRCDYFDHRRDIKNWFHRFVFRSEFILLDDMAKITKLPELALGVQEYSVKTMARKKTKDEMYLECIKVFFD